MLTLLSVRLFNFRAVKDATFAPLRDGITGLSGVNGIGKSAFLEGMLWALYGEVPRDVSQSDLKNDQAGDDDECYVQVEFEHNGQNVIATRSLRGKNRTAVLNTWLDGAPSTVTGVTVGQRWIADRLGIDAKGFTTAVLVQQKELDGLVEAKPAERRALIERLSGVDKMSDALRVARSELNDAKHRAEGATGSQEEITQAQEYASDCESEALAANDALHAATVTLEARKAEYTAVNDVYEALAETVRKVADTSAKVSRGENDLKVAQANLARAEEEVTHAKKSLPNGEVPQGDILAEARAEYNAAAATYRENQDAINEARSSAARALSDKEARESTLNHLNAVLEADRGDLATAQETLLNTEDFDIDTATADQASARNSVTVAVSELATREAEASALVASIESLSGADECPTCHTNLKDSKGVVASLKSLLSKAQSSRDAQKTVLDESENLLTLADENLSKAQSSVREKDSLLARISSLETSIAANEEKVTVAKDDIAKAKKLISSFETKAKKLLDGEAKLQEAGEKARENLSRAEGIDASVKSYQRVVDTRDFISRERDAREGELKAAKAALAALDTPTEEALASALDDKNAAIERGSAAASTVQDLKSDVRVLEERLKHAESALEAAESAYSAKRALLDDVSHKSAVAGVLDEFRKSQIARIAPELSDTATSLIARMTNGAFIEVELDEEFTPSVVRADGRSRPISWLSGGELSVVALALRIAIGDMLTGGTGGLLWLDEVLVSQDAGRRASLIETLRSLTGRQIVMINHTQGADDIVDKSIRLTRSPDGGTVLDES